jgi:hypothetical protein
LITDLRDQLAEFNRMGGLASLRSCSGLPPGGCPVDEGRPP